jgi:alpha-amylase/alpha-mannosidase (GH57 family)
LTQEEYLIIHGHFYQPPRENPWSGYIPNQISAAPFVNWNLRINRECYAPNTMARILDNTGAIDKIINNFRYMSFNVGPTLLSWMKTQVKDTYNLILEADRLGAQERDGHGPAIAQVFNHIIMPLANYRDKVTQIVWGKKFFQDTFKRDPEGMWLAETAVDLESLMLLKQNGIKFTILAQNQIAAIRPLTPLRTKTWEPLRSPVDPREPYRVFFGENDEDFIDCFVYDGPVSRAVAFENLLRDGQAFLSRIQSAFGSREDDWPRLVNLATDGESYGHHFHFGEMALAWLFDNLLDKEKNDQIRLTNYGQFLALHPPRIEAKIVENSSWSCAHGVERWRSDCGCHTGGDPSWNQKWRTPLRDGLNWLRDELIVIFERESNLIFKDPWAARNAYIDVINSDYDPLAKEAFLKANCTQAASDPNLCRKALVLMESQLMALYMFTSCAWFFDDLAGLEPIQNLRYACRAIQLCQKFSSQDLNEGLIKFLKTAIPNNPAYKNGEDLYQTEVCRNGLNASQAAAQWAAASSMNEPQALKQYRYLKVGNKETEKTLLNPSDQLPLLFTGKVSLNETRLGITSDRYALVLAEDGPKLNILVMESEFDKQPDFQKAKSLFLERGPSYLRSAFTGLFPRAESFTLDSLWPSVRDEILTGQLKDFFNELKEYTTKAFRNYHDALLRYSLKENAWDWMDQFVFRVMAEVDLENIIKPMRDGRPIDIARLKELISQEFGRSNRNTPVIRESVGIYIRKLFNQLTHGPGRPTLLEEIQNFLNFIKSTLGEMDLWEFQNMYFQLINREMGFFRSLGEADRIILSDIGHILGFSDNITGRTLIS